MRESRLGSRSRARAGRWGSLKRSAEENRAGPGKLEPGVREKGHVVAENDLLEGQRVAITIGCDLCLGRVSFEEPINE
jgi:hypothetical protein